MGQDGHRHGMPPPRVLQRSSRRLRTSLPAHQATPTPVPAKRQPSPTSRGVRGRGATEPKSNHKDTGKPKSAGKPEGQRLRQLERRRQHSRRTNQREHEQRHNERYNSPPPLQIRRPRRRHADQDDAGPRRPATQGPRTPPRAGWRVDDPAEEAPPIHDVADQGEALVVIMEPPQRLPDQPGAMASTPRRSGRSLQPPQWYTPPPQ